MDEFENAFKIKANMILTLNIEYPSMHVVVVVLDSLEGDWTMTLR